MAYFDLGRFTRPVTTSVPEAQLWFDRGLIWCYGYNHEEAVACFKRALQADPNCAMAQWGIAYATGPNYNMQWHHFDPAGKAQALATACDATQAAMALRDRVTGPERALIEALPARYPQRETIEDQTPWNRAFAQAMRAAYAAHPQDLEVAAIFAEAIMNMTPWAMWDLATGLAADGAGTEEARAVLETALARDPAASAHPGILHLYVHLMEMSPFPELALQAGDRLRDLVPDAGHLIHMPTHIDVQCGAYRDTLATNQRAIEADKKYRAHAGDMNFYTGYRVHNFHFAIYGAMLLGQYAPALAAAEALNETVPEALLRTQSPPMADFLESYTASKLHVLIRFGKWREIIALALPDDRELYCYRVATTEYAKGVAHAALGELAEAEDAQARFLTARDRVPETRLLHNNSCLALLAVAEAMLAGEIAYRKGAHDAAFAHLRRAVALDDGLLYDEPWGWMQPTRHALGALLLEQGRIEESEQVYREDLGLAGRLPRAMVHPDNLWSLKGLYDCLTRRDAQAEARLIKLRLEIAAARADIDVSVSCFCARAAE
ncbi:MAG: tetratricopeptide repeat protein [Pseudomonadota bacterium]